MGRESKPGAGIRIARAICLDAASTTVNGALLCAKWRGRNRMAILGEPLARHFGAASAPAASQTLSTAGIPHL